MVCPCEQMGGRRRRRRRIRRKGFTFVRNGKRIVVPSTLIKDRGNPGKGPKLIPPLKQGDLVPFGYKNVTTLTKLQRHRRLNKALKRKFKTLSLARKLRALATLTKNTDPKRSRIFRLDAEWLFQKHKKMKHQK